MILKFHFITSSEFVGYFLDFWAQKSGLKYSLVYDENSVSLFVEDDDLKGFIDEYISMIPSCIFVAQTGVEVATKMPPKNPKTFDIFSKNITPLALKTGVNEFGFTTSPEAVGTLLAQFKADKKVVYDGFEISEFSDFSGDFVVATELKNLAKIAVADEKSLIALASFEKPVLDLKINAIFKNAHKNSPNQIAIRAAWDGILMAFCEELYKEGINFISVKTKNSVLKVMMLENSVAVINCGEFINKNDKAFLASQNDTDLALFGLILKEFGLLDNPVIKAHLSGDGDDEIVLYKENSEFNLLDLKIPKSFEELFNGVKSLENGETLLSNFSAKFQLPKGEINGKNSFKSLFKIAQKICGFDRSLSDLAANFAAHHGVRVDYKIIGANKFDWAKFIASIMSFRLAGAEPSNIAYGAFEGIVDMLGDIGDNADGAKIIGLGELFANRFFAQIASQKGVLFSSKYSLF